MIRKLLTKLSIGISGLVFLLVQPAYAFAATLSLNPTSATVNRGCNFSVAIDLDTAGKDTDGTDAIIIYDPARFTVSKINNGTIYPDYPGNTFDAKTGKINVSGLASVDQAFSSKGTLATIDFVVNSAAPTGTTQLTFDFDPNNKTKTTDSNVVERNTLTDLLDTVNNGTYTIGSGACGTTGTGTTGSIGQKPVGSVDNSSSSGKVLPDTADVSPTILLGVVGGFLTVLGIIGLALL